MSKAIINAAPMVRNFNTQDNSPRVFPRSPDVLPQHLPKIYIYAERGDTQETLCTSVEAIRKYGEKTFDERGKYANHATVFANAFRAHGNACIYKRLLPDDVGPNANVTLYLDVLETTVDLYERNSDGAISTDAMGQPILNGSTSGWSVKWVVGHARTLAELDDFGKRTYAPGNQIDPMTGTQSTRYPIMEFKVGSAGAYGNNIGFRIWAPTALSSRMPTRMMREDQAYPFHLSLIEKPVRYTSPDVTETIMGEQYISAVFKHNVVDPLTDRRMYLGDIFGDSYSNINDPRYPIIPAPFSDLFIYNENIDLLLEQFHEKEIPFMDSLSDMSADPASRYLFNIFGAVDSSNRPYHSFIFSNGTDSVRLTQYTNIYADGGSDGTMSESSFANLVSQEVRRYLDNYDPLQDIASHPESTLYDSGFPLETKLDLTAFIALRPDTFVHLGTYTVGEEVRTSSEEYSIAIALRTRLRNFPESEYFGTSTMRGLVTGYSAKIRNSRYSSRLPLTYEVAIKSADYMGASNGRWTSGRSFTGAPGHIVSEMYDISITWVPEPVRNRNWDVGLNWVQRYDLKSFYFPAFKTIYDEDTSVLTSYLNVMAICQLNKVSFHVHAEFSGRDDLTDAQFVERVNESVRRRVEGIFDGRFIIEPVATITEMDSLRGYSWTLPIRIFANNGKTLMTTYVQAYRMSDAATVVGTPADRLIGA